MRAPFRQITAAILVFAFTILCAAQAAEARAGGGHSFGGSRSSGGHSFGNHGSSHFGGSSSGIRYHGTGGNLSPGVVIAIIIVVILILLLKYYLAQQQTQTIRRGIPAADDQARANALAALQRDDPSFDPAVFCSAISRAFTLVQQAWSGMKLEPIRPFVSDGVFERFTLQMQEMQAVGYRNVVEDLRVLSVTVASIEVDEFFQTIAVRITASAHDYDVSLTDGKRLRPSAPSRFTEVWSFIRRRGTRTPAEGGFKLLESNCPNCGGSLEMNQHARCKQCGAIVRNGQYDWVLAEITQESEWDGRPQADVPGLAALRQRDPALSIQSLEDTASVIFYRKIAAGWARDARPLRKMATETFCRNFPALLGDTYYTNCGVGSVSVLGLYAEGTQDHAVVRITWSGTRHLASSGRGYGGRGESGVISQLFVLTRDSSTSTCIDNAISSAHCPNCGGPMQHDASPACEYCGTTLNDGKHGWVLDGVHGVSSSESQNILRACRDGLAKLSLPPIPVAAPPARGAEMLGWLVQTVMADGELSAKEQKYLQTVAQHRQVSPERLDSLIEAARRGDLSVASPADRDEARAWLEAMTEAGFADGRLTTDEVKILQMLAAANGFTHQELNVLINAVRKRLLQGAREALRNRP